MFRKMKDARSATNNKIGYGHHDIAYMYIGMSSKCQVLHITRSKQPLNTQYTLHDQVLEATVTAKYLGVTISKDLSWNDHISPIISKANSTLGFVKRNVKTSNVKVK